MLDISLWLLILTALILFALVYYLDKTLYKPLLIFMRKRDELIRDDKESLKQSGSEAEEALLKANETISKAKAKAAKLKEAEITAAKESAASEISKVQDEIEKKYETFLKELSSQRDSLKKNLVANLSSYQDAFASKLKSL